ncbi:hypothetical protein [Pedobacter cryoconitis]|uniref:Uncharacterized protein n=1 Tax=Pedobacter cryoconitis TaxID=188932 RepID=A0A327SIJ1_9SPHI|nr:hypothetical protein [Pedobacter cryoconitis]RAJ28869.1 hypothetical protein LY11_03143 [Pedobacter cryoconitis]
MDLKDITYPLRVAYIAKLAGLKYNEVTVPIYDSIVPETAPSYFVVIRDQNEADHSLKCGFNTDVHVTLDVVTKFPPGAGSGIVRDAISSKINSLICTENYSLRLNLLPDFNVMNSIRTLSRQIEELSKTENIFRRINIYKHEIQQLR